MIHQAFKKAVIARLYYFELRGITLRNEAARKRFALDKHINKTILRKVLEQVRKEQSELLKSQNTTSNETNEI